MYDNDFLNQYSNNTIPNHTLPSLALGGVAGGGLGALFASLTGASVLPALGIGALGGSALGGIANSLHRNSQIGSLTKTRKDAFNRLSPQEQQKVTQSFLTAMENSAGNDGSFYSSYEQDPQFWTEFMLNNM